MGHKNPSLELKDDKKNDIWSFNLMECIEHNHILNITINANQKFANKVTTIKLITYNGKMPTDDIIKSK